MANLEPEEPEQEPDVDCSEVEVLDLRVGGSRQEELDLELDLVDLGLQAVTQRVAN